MRYPALVLVATFVVTPLAAAARATPTVVDFWSWFAGPSAAPGAYGAPAMPCQTVHGLVNQYSRSGKRFVTQDGQEYAYNFLISLGANARICRDNDAPVIPAEAMMPQRFPVSFVSWLDEHDGDKAIRRAAMGYLAAADADADPIGAMKAQRKLFWESAMKAVLSEPDQRARICREIEPENKACPDQLQTRTLDELYAAGRKAPRAEAPAAEPGHPGPARAPEAAPSHDSGDRAPAREH